MSALFHFRGEYNFKALKKIPCYVIFYPTGLAVCVVEPKLIKAETKRITAELKANKIGILKRPALIQQGLEEYGKQFSKQQPDAILNADNRNKWVTYDDALDVVYQSRPKDVKGGDFNTTIPGRFVLKTANDKILVTHDYEKGASFERALEQIFSSKIKFK